MLREEETVEQKDVYDPKKDVDGSMLADLEEALELRGVQNREEVLERFKRGEAVSVDMPRENLSLEEALDAERSRIADMDGTTPQDAPQHTAQLVVVTKNASHTRFAFVLHGTQRFLVCSGCKDDFVGFMSLDGKHKRGTRVALETPMLGLRKSAYAHKKWRAKAIPSPTTLRATMTKRNHKQRRKFG